MDSPFLGMVQYFAFDWAPKGYALANGALLSIQQNAALFALFGTFYGGNGTSTFGLPDLRGRGVVGQSNSYTMGERFGTTTASLLTINMPSHTHSASGAIACNNTSGGTGTAGANYPAALKTGGRGGGGPANMYTATADPNNYLAAPTVTIAAAGQSVPFSTQNPYIAVTATISTVGLFPSRN
jgi:microcystin-dependent protein